MRLAAGGRNRRTRLAEASLRNHMRLAAGGRNRRTRLAEASLQEKKIDKKRNRV